MSVLLACFQSFFWSLSRFAVLVVRLKSMSRSAVSLFSHFQPNWRFQFVLTLALPATNEQMGFVDICFSFDSPLLFLLFFVFLT